MTKSSVPFVAMAVMVILALAHRVSMAINALAPTGYEDEDGFHFGGPSQAD
ncbi:MAG TPA: hypothetical protein VHB20_07115 [Verrucomicrobiae bacterium]|jgi:hypothetical protein|nr:hypothetical protein [Verrucomicrobiae bacterium]